MKSIRIFILIISSVTIHFSFGQAVEEKISKIYYSESDKIRYTFSNYPDELQLNLSERDTISPGTNTGKDVLMTAFIGKDTLRIKADNYPYARRSFVTIKTPGKTTVVIFRFNAVSSNFSQEYIQHNEGKISYEVPEVYELSNIVWALSPSGKRASDLQTNTDYYKKVEHYFKPYLDHPIFKKLDFETKEYYDNYYSFRENSFIYEFNGNRIVKGENYNYVFGNDWDGFSNLFTELLPLIQDFSDKSGFREFYKQNKAYYLQDIEKMKHLLPIKNMWGWLEKEFPKKFNAYKIVFSPLIGGSHSTQNYYGKNENNNSWFGETVMFVCNTHRYDSRTELTEEQKQGLMSGIVFTEIDHNYVNPESAKYRKEIAEIFNLKIWRKEGAESYNSPQSVFNEYMTHALFCLWVTDNYDKKTADLVIDERIKMNVNKRGFIKFKEFNEVLFKLKKEHPDKTVAQLYPQIIEWSKHQK